MRTCPPSPDAMQKEPPAQETSVNAGGGVATRRGVVQEEPLNAAAAPPASTTRHSAGLSHETLGRPPIARSPGRGDCQLPLTRCTASPPSVITTQKCALEHDPCGANSYGALRCSTRCDPRQPDSA